MEANDEIREDILQETAPKLSSVNKENPFDVPENYFNDLSGKISDKCTPPEKKNSKPVIQASFQKVLLPLAIAASVIIIILISHKKNNDNSISTVQYTYTDNSTASEYLESLIDNGELDESLIISELINDDTTKSYAKNGNAEEKTNVLYENPVIIHDTLNNVTITEDDIIQYLLEEDESDDLLY